MAYTPRTFDQITQDAIDYAVGQRTAVSDFNKGAVIRTLIEAFTLEQARLYLGLAQGINEAQENAAYQTFGFTRLPAAYAYGQVLFVRDPGAALDATTVIPKGTQLSSSSTGVTYVTSTDVTLDATTSQQLVVATATTPGAIGNANAGQITIVTGGAASFFSLGQVTNPRAFITGADLETDAQRRVRFAQFLQGLHRATKEAILFGVQQTVLFDSAGYIVEQVLKAQTIEEAPGLVWVWVHNGVGNTSNDLVQQADNVLSGYIDATGVVHTGWKAAGIRTQVFAATETAVPVEPVGSPRWWRFRSRMRWRAICKRSTWATSVGWRASSRRSAAPPVCWTSSLSPARSSTSSPVMVR
jgi:hypothetical protein